MMTGLAAAAQTARAGVANKAGANIAFAWSSQLDHDRGLGIPVQSSAGVETLETNTTRWK
jgi:hypothetical protein